MKVLFLYVGRESCLITCLFRFLIETISVIKYEANNCYKKNANE